MSEFVVVQVWTAYALTDGKDGRWLDYSRCTASQAQSLLISPPRSERTGKRMALRAKHWISGEELNSSQLARMASDEMSRFQDRAPGAGDFWNVTVDFETEPDRTRTRITSVDAWTGKPWEQLVFDVSLLAAEHGWTVRSLRLAG